MPLIEHSTYKAPLLFRNNHLNTIYPALFRKVNGVVYERERFYTPDEDFLDLDWSINHNKQLVIVLHGLEGSADRAYIKGIIKYFNQNNWDGVGVNFRGCSGEVNWKLNSYHMGASDDLDIIIKHIIKEKKYQKIALVGFSLGGNVVLKYLGEQGKALADIVKAAVAFSVPCYIPTANKKIDQWYNWLYLNRFLNSLNAKVLEKNKKFPDKLKVTYPLPRNFRTFDDQYTAPLHGFKDAADYWERCSSRQFLNDINVPTLIINAKDDSFLSKECFPIEEANLSKWVYLERPNWGGHVGFVTFGKKNTYWSEERAMQFVQENA